MAKPGPNRTPTETLKRRGSRLPERPGRANEPDPPSGLPEPPELNRLAQPIWDYYLPILDGMGVVSPAERDYLAEMCRSLAVVEFCHSYIDGAIEAGDPKLLMELGGSGHKEHPILATQRKYWQQAEKIAAKLGLNPTDRSNVDAVPLKASAADPDNLIRLALERAN